MQGQVLRPPRCSGVPAGKPTTEALHLPLRPPTRFVMLCGHVPEVVDTKDE